jgi:hypothetical protein
MDDRRKFKRRHTIRYFEVHNVATDRPAGRVVDITSEGMMLISDQPIETDRVYKLRMALPERMGVKNEIDLEARSVWCRHDVNFDFYDTGFQFVALTQDNLDIIRHPLQKYLFRN